MTEEEWLESDDLGRMLGVVYGLATDRKLRLFAVACCREGFDSYFREVEAAELFADGLLTAPEYDKVMAEVHPYVRTFVDASYLLDTATSATRWRDACAGASKAGRAASSQNRDLWKYGGKPHYCIYIRELFGPLPFRPVTINPSWRTANVVSLAQAIYDERAFDRMPILGDALEDAGCDNAEVLGHCRGPGEHVRGCWVVDLLLGKE